MLRKWRWKIYFSEEKMMANASKEESGERKSSKKNFDEENK